MVLKPVRRLIVMENNTRPFRRYRAKEEANVLQKIKGRKGHILVNRLRLLLNVVVYPADRSSSTFFADGGYPKARWR